MMKKSAWLFLILDNSFWTSIFCSARTTLDFAIAFLWEASFIPVFNIRFPRIELISS